MKTKLKPNTIRKLAIDSSEHVKSLKIFPPATLRQLEKITSSFIYKYPEHSDLDKWAMIMINNALWMPAVSGVPYEKRMLLIPQCLKNSDKCQAQIDEYGLLCESCGACDIDRITRQAEEMGIMCMVAEGSAIVEELVKSGSIDAIIGVSCFEALEKAFDHMNRNAIPSLALPLFNEGCKNTETDIDYLTEIMLQKSDHVTSILDLNGLLDQVRSWFLPDALDTVMQPPVTKSEQLSREWISVDGKRYRPFLCVATAQALGKDFWCDDSLKKLAISIECFHKASLIHDDIEDDDDLRNGIPTLHKQTGMPTALNIGDLLLGEGYRLIAQTDLDDGQKARLFHAAANGHMELCRGQGDELLIRSSNELPGFEKAIEIFRRKTAPAFNLAFQFGAEIMNASDDQKQILRRFSDNLGIAYQIADDIDDSNPTASERLDMSIVDILAQRDSCCICEAKKSAAEIYYSYREEALHSLQNLQHQALKMLLFRVTTQILKDIVL